MSANSGEPDQPPDFAAYDLVLHCLPMSQIKEAKLIWVNQGNRAIYSQPSNYFKPLSALQQTAF